MARCARYTHNYIWINLYNIHFYYYWPGDSQQKLLLTTLPRKKKKSTRTHTFDTHESHSKKFIYWECAQTHTHSESKKKHSSVKPNEFGKLSKLSFCFIQSSSSHQFPVFFSFSLCICVIIFIVHEYTMTEYILYIRTSREWKVEKTQTTTTKITGKKTLNEFFLQQNGEWCAFFIHLYLSIYIFNALCV